MLSNYEWVIMVFTVFTVFRLLTDFVCLYNYEFWLSLCKIVRSSVILLLPLFISFDVKFLWVNQRYRLLLLVDDGCYHLTSLILWYVLLNYLHKILHINYYVSPSSNTDIFIVLQEILHLLFLIHVYVFLLCKSRLIMIGTSIIYTFSNGRGIPNYILWSSPLNWQWLPFRKLEFFLSFCFM